MTSRRFQHDVPNRQPGMRRMDIRAYLGNNNYQVTMGDGTTQMATGSGYSPGDSALGMFDTATGSWVLMPGSTTATKTLVFFIAGQLTAGSQPIRLLSPAAMSITDVNMIVNTAPTGADLIIDVNKNGTTIFTTQADRPTIVAGAFFDELEAPPPVTALAVNDIVTIDIDQIGTTVPGANLVVQVRCLVN